MNASLPLPEMVGLASPSPLKFRGLLGYEIEGNVVLQFCGLTVKDISATAEVNADKFGCVTPGTHIPIISEAEARAIKRIISWCCLGTSKRAFCTGKKNILRVAVK